MRQWIISCFLFQIFFLALLVACTADKAGSTESKEDRAMITPGMQKEVSWLHHPEARILRVTFCCSPLMSPTEELAYLPEAQVWGDGRIIWVEREPVQR